MTLHIAIGSQAPVDIRVRCVILDADRVIHYWRDDENFERVISDVAFSKPVQFTVTP